MYPVPLARQYMYTSASRGGDPDVLCSAGGEICINGLGEICSCSHDACRAAVQTPHHHIQPSSVSHHPTRNCKTAHDPACCLLAYRTVTSTTSPLQLSRLLIAPTNAASRLCRRPPRLPSSLHPPTAPTAAAGGELPHLLTAFVSASGTLPPPLARWPYPSGNP